MDCSTWVVGTIVPPYRCLKTCTWWVGKMSVRQGQCIHLCRQLSLQTTLYAWYYPCRGPGLLTTWVTPICTWVSIACWSKHICTHSTLSRACGRNPWWSCTQWASTNGSWCSARKVHRGCIPWSKTSQWRLHWAWPRWTKWTAALPLLQAARSLHALVQETGAWTCRWSEHNNREDELTSMKGSRLRDHHGQHPFSSNRKTWRGSDPCSRSLPTGLDRVDCGWWDPGGIWAAQIIGTRPLVWH